MSLGRKGWLVGFSALAVLGAACNGEIAGVPGGGEDTDGGESSGNGNGSSGKQGSSGNGSSGNDNGSSGNGSSGNPDGGPITGPSTTVSGVALAPNGVTPLGQVTVSWSRTAPAPLPTGAFCSACTPPPAGTAAVSAANGSFQLTVPVNEDVFVTTQMGNFRRVRAYRFAQTDTLLAQSTTTLPGRTELAVGDTVPTIGILTSTFDDIAQAFDELGVKGLVNLTSNDLANPVELQRYQIVLLPSAASCEEPRAQEPTVQAALRQYVSAGGALYTSDYGYEYFNRSFPGFVQFAGNGQVGAGCVTPEFVTGRYDDVSLATWLAAPAAGNDFGQVFARIDGTVTQPGPGRNGATTNLVPKTWATVTSTATPTPAMVSVPYGCGQAFVSTVTAGELGGGAPTPNGILRGRALAFMLFRAHDGCIESPAPACVGTVGAQCTPGTPPVQGAACGYCGTSVQRCSNECKLLASACENEQPAADRCLPGSNRLSSAGCPAGEVRTQSCQGGVGPDAARCTWAAPAGVCAGPQIPFVSVATLGATASRVVTVADQQLMNVPGSGVSACPSADVRSRMAALTEIRNESGVAIKVDVTVTPKRGGAVPDRTLAVYTTTPPLDDATTMSCSFRNDDCATIVNTESCVQLVNIPAGGKIWALVANYSASAEAGELAVNVKRVQ